MMKVTITILERECAEDDFDTESGQGMPDDVEAVVDEVIVLEDDTSDDAIQEVLNFHGVGQWDGGHTGYDPDGSSMDNRGIRTERFARIDRNDN